jgi:hypothetical protein
MYGELTYLVDAGAVVFPNFFQRLHPPRGMHGYTPDVEANWAHVIVLPDGSPVRAGGRGRVAGNLVDVFPTLAELLGLDVPAGLAARSLLEAG